MTGREQTKKGLFSRIRSSHMLAVGLALAVTLWVASGVVTSKAPTKEEVSAKEPEALMLVRVRESNAVNHDLYVTLFGRTEAVRKIELAAETPGKVVARPVEKGTWVKKGVPIVKLSVDDRMARLRDALHIDGQIAATATVPLRRLAHRRPDRHALWRRVWHRREPRRRLPPGLWLPTGSPVR